MSHTMTRWTGWLVGLLIVIACVHPAAAASSISAKYDGVYSGAASPTPKTASSSCVAIPIDKVVIAQGTLRSQNGPDQPVISGFITETGYVSGWMTSPGGKRYEMDGRLTGDTIAGGAIDKATNCEWVVNLARQP